MITEFRFDAAVYFFCLSLILALVISELCAIRRALEKIAEKKGGEK
jgi:hypothetical protein